MSTDAAAQSPGATSLVRRMEELAARSFDDDAEPIGPVLTAALSGLRAELGGLRSELGSLRAEFGVVRTGVESGSGRTASALASARSELADVGRAHDALAERVQALTIDFEALLAAVPELRSAVDTVPDRTASEVDGSLRRLHADVAGSVEESAEDLRRTLSTGLTQAAAGTRAAEVAWTETRSALEERLAAVEDTLDALAERLEALGRDTATAAGARLDQLDQQVSALQHAVESEVELAGAERARAAVADEETAESLETWGEAVRGALGDMGEAVSEGLTRLGTTLDQAVRGASDDDREHLRARLTDLAEVVDGAFAGLEEQISAVHASADSATAGLQSAVSGLQERVEERVEAMRVTLADGLATAGDQVMARLQDTVGELTAANSAGREQIEIEMAALRADLADALEDVRSRVAATVEGARDAIQVAVDGQQEHWDDLARQLRGDLLDRLEATGAELQTGVDEIRTRTASAATASESTSARVNELADTAAQLAEEVAALRADWGPRTEAVVDASRQAAEATIAQLRDEAGSLLASFRQDAADLIQTTREQAVDAMGAVHDQSSAALSNFREEASATHVELRAAIRRLTVTLEDAVNVLQGGTDRLSGSGQALLAYLAARDRLLEEQRDHYLREVLEQFAADLPGKERRAVAGRVGEALDRRRDVRDADRWRRSQAGQPVPAVPDLPGELTVLGEPTAPHGADASTVAAEPMPPTVATPETAVVEPAQPSGPDAAGGAPADADQPPVAETSVSGSGRPDDVAAGAAESTAAAEPEQTVDLAASPPEVTEATGTPKRSRGLFRRRAESRSAAGNLPAAETPPAEFFEGSAAAGGDPEPGSPSADGSASAPAKRTRRSAGTGSARAPRGRKSTTGATAAKTAKKAPAKRGAAKTAKAGADRKTAAAGQTASGKSAAGKGAAAKATGKTTAGKTTAGKTTAGKTTAGKTTAGKTTARKTTARKAGARTPRKSATSTPPG